MFVVLYVVLAFLVLACLIVMLLAYVICLDDHEDASAWEIRKWRRLDMRNRSKSAMPDTPAEDIDPRAQAATQTTVIVLEPPNLVSLAAVQPDARRVRRR